MKTLERRLTLPSVIAISMAAMLGSGLFVLPGIAAGYTGPSVWLAYLVAGICVLPASLSKAELATAMPESGGTYVYIDRTFGPLAGTVAGLGLWLSLLLKSAFALVGFGAYLSVLAPNVPLRPVAMLLLVIVIGLNVLGVRKVGKVQTFVVVVVVIALCILAGQGVMTFEQSYLEPFFPQGIGGFWSTVSFVYISYAGVTKVAAIAEEVQNPGRNLPIGIIASLGIVTVLYSVVTFVLVGNVPTDQLVGDLHPIYTMANVIAGPWVGTGAAVLGVVTMTSMANSGLLAASRFPFAMSRNGLLPSPLRYVSPRLMTPIPAIVLTGSLMAAAIALLDLESIAKIASSLMILSYMVECIAVLVLREGSVQWYKPDFRSPFYPWLQVTGVVLGLGLLFMLGFTSVIAMVAISGPGLLLFFVYGRNQTDRRGVLGRLGPRQDLLSSDKPHLELPQKAAVVVPLLGRAHGAEALAELGDALGGDAKIEVVRIRNVPEQIGLDTELDDPLTDSLRRRILKLADVRQRDMVFDSVVTHDHIRVVHEISRRVHCEWLVMGWQKRTESGVLPINPLGWLVDHLSCNLALYKDVGSRSVASILVFPEPGPHDGLVVITADHLARVHDADLTFVRWVDGRNPGSEEAEKAYLAELCDLCSTPAKTRLVYGSDETKAVAVLTPEYDLLILGAQPEARWWTRMRGSRADWLMEQSTCSALRLKAPRRLVDRSFAGSGVDHAGTRIDEYLAGECVDAQLGGMSKQALFSHFSSCFAEVLEGVSAEEVEEALWERERSQNTAIGNGMAVPHATLSGAKRSFMGVFTTSSPIDYRTPDGAPVDVFVMTVGPPSDRNTHLRILSVVAWLVTKTPFLERIRAADNQSELLSMLLASSTMHAKPLSETPPDLDELSDAQVLAPVSEAAAASTSTSSTEPKSSADPEEPGEDA